MAVTYLLKAVVEWSGLGEIGTLSFFYVGNDASHTPAELNSAAAAAKTNLATSESPSSKQLLLGRLLPGQTPQSLRIYEYPTDSDPASAIGAASLADWGAGSASAAFEPLQVAQVVTLLTDIAGRSYRGRLYLPFQNSAPDNKGEASQSSMDAAAQFAVNWAGDIADGLMTTLSIGTLEWGVYSRKLHAVTPITSVRVDSRLDVQRRRANSETPTRVSSYSA